MSSHLKRIFDLYENGSNYIEIKYKIYLEKGILYSINEIKDILYPPNKSSSQLIKENTKSEFSQLIPNHSSDNISRIVTYFFKEKLIEVSTGNQNLDYLIKTIVRDNVITEAEKDFIYEKSEEFDFDQKQLNSLDRFIGVNNPYLDKIIDVILEDGIITDKELHFLFEKVKENNFDKPKANTRFWVIAFAKYYINLLQINGFDEIIKLIFIYLEFGFSDTNSDQEIFYCLDIFSCNSFNEIIEKSKEELKTLLIIFLENNTKVKNIDKFINDALYAINLTEGSTKKENIKNVTANKTNVATNLSVNNFYKKTDLYSIFNVSKDQQNGKWNNGYCKHDGNWFIFANIDQTGSGFYTEFNYKNNFDEFGDLNWETVKDSKLEWESIQDLQSSTPYVFIRTPKTKKHHWKFIGTGYCIYTLDTSPVIFKWKIDREDKSKVIHNKTTSINSKKEFEWNSKIVPIRFKEKILKLINDEGVFEASQKYLALAYDNGVEDPGKVMDEFEKITANLID